MNHSLILPLPPSTNRRMIRSRTTGFQILSTEARDWLLDASKLVWVYCNNNKIKPYNYFFHLDLRFFLTRSNADSHNYLKLLCDALEKGGLCTDDRYIMTRIQMVDKDPKNPRVELSF